MKILEFSFKREAGWIVVFLAAMPLIGIIILLIFWLFR